MNITNQAALMRIRKQLQIIRNAMAHDICDKDDVLLISDIHNEIHQMVRAMTTEVLKKTREANLREFYNI